MHMKKIVMTLVAALTFSGACSSISLAEHAPQGPGQGPAPTELRAKGPESHRFAKKKHHRKHHHNKHHRKVRARR
ncbi:MAG: hypothetical protein FDX30_03860 [Chlorobium sp.]|nr:MAG: hypothetical protein FDX30_03860 [Chlorobium sp.]